MKQESTIERLLNSPLAAKFQRDEERSKTSRRQKLLKEIEDIRTQEERDIPELSKKTSRMGAAVEQAEAVLTQARGSLHRAYSEEASLRLSLRTRRERLEAELAADAPKCIQEFLKELEREATALRHRKPNTYERPTGEVDAKTGAKRTQFFSNKSAIDNRLDAIVRARREAEAIRVEVTTIEDAGKRIKEIRSRLPEIGKPQLVA